jgi:hypothetical protein
MATHERRIADRTVFEIYTNMKGEFFIIRDYRNPQRVADLMLNPGLEVSDNRQKTLEIEADLVIDGYNPVRNAGQYALIDDHNYVIYVDNPSEINEYKYAVFGNHPNIDLIMKLFGEGLEYCKTSKADILTITNAVDLKVKLDKTNLRMTRRVGLQNVIIQRRLDRDSKNREEGSSATGGSRRRRRRPSRKYKKSKRVLRRKSRSTRRR